MKDIRKATVLGFFILALGIGVACSKAEPPAPVQAGESQAAPAPKLEPKAIQIRGSDSELNVVQALAEAYMKQNPNVRIAVTGGGSGTGIAALLNKTVDIANSSRNIKPAEQATAQAQGVQPVRFVFSMDAIAVIVHPENKLASLTIEQAGQIFRGEFKNWKEAKGPNLPITRYGRQSNSGTYEFFKEHVLKGDFSSDVREMNGNAQIVESVKQDKGGIGYVAAGYVLPNGKPIDGVRILAMSPEQGKDPVAIAPDTVANMTYPIVRSFNQYLNGKPNAVLDGFLKFELSPQGQKIVTEQGFFPVTPELRAMSEQVCSGAP